MRLVAQMAASVSEDRASLLNPLNERIRFISPIKLRRRHKLVVATRPRHCHSVPETMRQELHQRWPVDPFLSISDVQQSSVDTAAQRLGNLRGRDGEILCQVLGGEPWVILNREL